MKNGRDKSGPYMTGNKLPFLLQEEAASREDGYTSSEEHLRERLTAHTRFIGRRSRGPIYRARRVSRHRRVNVSNILIASVGVGWG